MENTPYITETHKNFFLAKYILLLEKIIAISEGSPISHAIEAASQISKSFLEFAESVVAYL